MSRLQQKVPSNEKIGISQGPSREDLLEALGDRNLKVVFVSVLGREFEATIRCLQPVENSSKNWNIITGFALDPKDSVPDRKWRNFAAQFSTKKREGRFWFTD
jgi:hypothetical protein